MNQRRNMERCTNPENGLFSGNDEMRRRLNPQVQSDSADESVNGDFTSYNANSGSALTCSCPLTRPMRNQQFLNGQTRPGGPMVRKWPRKPISFSAHRQTLTLSPSRLASGFLLWTFIANPILLGFWEQPIGVLLVEGCFPGPHSGPERRGKGIQPMRVGQYKPHMSELTLGASGPAEGPIARNSKRFRQLMESYDPMVVFKEDAGSEDNSRHIMSRRCSDRLSTLASWVFDTWGVKVRVTEAWAPENTHEENSLHYEGRAVDLDMADGDSDKYPMLAGMALEAGFDWVYFEGPNHIHCSVISDSSDAAREGGCFPGDALVQVPGGGQVPMTQLRPGDDVITVDEQGRTGVDTVLTFMDWQPVEMRNDDDGDEGIAEKRMLVEVRTADGFRLRLTPNHLLYVSSRRENAETRSKLNSAENVETRSRLNPAENAKTWSRQNAADQENENRWNRQNSAENVETWSGRLSFGRGWNDNIRHLTTPVARFAGNTQPGQYVYVTMTNASRPDGATVRPSRVVSVRAMTSSAGAFAPMTRSGKIVVDGVVTSCYAAFENDAVSHLVMAPVRWFHLARLRVSAWIGLPRRQRDVEPGISLYARSLFHVASSLLPKSIFRGA